MSRGEAQSRGVSAAVFVLEASARGMIGGVSYMRRN